MSESTPTQRPVSRGRTCGLMSCVKHCDILQTPMSERCHTLAIIVMGGSGRLNQRAGDLYYVPQYVGFIHTHTYSGPPSVSAVRDAATHTPGWTAGGSLTALFCTTWFSACPTSRHCFIISSVSLHIPPSVPLDLNITSTFSNLHFPSTQYLRKFASCLYFVQELAEDKARSGMLLS